MPHIFKHMQELKDSPLSHLSSHILIVRGEGSYHTIQESKDFQDFLIKKKVCYFEASSPLPHFKRAKNLSEKIKDFKPDLIIAVGGGSIIDTAKTALLIERGGVYWEEGKENLSVVVSPLPSSPYPLMAIPTTAGSGSEATHFSVCYHNNKKYSLSHPSLKPSFVLLYSPSLTSLSPLGLAIPIADSLSQAIESLLSINCSLFSSFYSFSSLEKSSKGLFFENPEENIFNSSLSEYKKVNTLFPLLQEASYEAGCAIDITKTTVAHALSYTLTRSYKVPHGQAVALFLPAVLEVTLSFLKKEEVEESIKDKIKERFSLLKTALSPFIKRFYPEIKNQETFEREKIPSLIKEIFKKMHLKTSLREIKDINNLSLITEDLTSEVNGERLKNYFITLESKDLEEIIKRSY